jgi:acyl-coenzyme A thioesterase PaaI-like protein
MRRPKVRALGYRREMSERNKNMDRWLGDGGMAIVGALGGSFESYGVDGEDLGWAAGSFVPTELACNPHGAVQAGVHGVVLDAVMNFAINAALRGRDRTNSTIEMTSELLRPALRNEHYLVRGDVVRLTKQIAYAEASITSHEGKLVSRATGTFLVHREASN